MYWDKRRSLRIGLVNNMPDAAIRAADAQFSTLIDAALQPAKMEIVRYNLGSVRRSTEACSVLDEMGYRCFSFSADQLDAMFITGTEPSQRDLTKEIFWHELTEMLDWANQAGCPTLVSCLAAHATLLYFDNIERVQRHTKCFGIFKHNVDVGHGFTESLRETYYGPHSRMNSVTLSDLRRNDFDILISGTVGFFCAYKKRKAGFLYLQGHPEYAGSTLFKEYRRDVGRFLSGERVSYPKTPYRYFLDDALPKIQAFSKRAHCDHRPELLADFPAIVFPQNFSENWQNPIRKLIGNWLLEEWESQESLNGYRASTIA